MSRTITISITVPDGVDVQVSQGGGSTRPFVPRPDPIFPTWDSECSVHGLEWVLWPAGTSKKTGKPYNSFWKCPGGGGTDYCNEKPGRQPRDEGDDLGF